MRLRRALSQAFSRGVVALLALALLKPWPLHAQPSAGGRPDPAATAQPEEDPLILTIKSNGVERGEFRLLRRAGGDYWLTEADLPRLKLSPTPAARRQLGDQVYYSLAALGATALHFDEAALALSLDFPAPSLQGTQIDLSNRPPPLAVTPAGMSLIFSYRLSTRQSGPVRETTAFNELNVRAGPLLLRQEARLNVSGFQRRFVRGPTQVIHDDPAHARRWTAGDQVSSAGAFGRTITGAGISVATTFDMVPDLVRNPTARITTSTALPADVELSVDGATIFRGSVGPGPISMDNLLLYGGTRNVRLTVTDVTGRREVIEQPFLFTDSVLAQGLHEYRYFAGRRSEIGANDQLQYREAAWQAFHRYGMSNDVTVAAGGEGNSAFTTAGAGITLRSDRLGLFSLDLLANRDRQAARQSAGWSGRYSYHTPGYSFQFGHRQFERGFRSFTDPFRVPFLLEETRIGAATSIGRASLAADMVRTRDTAETRVTRSLRLSSNIGKSTSISAELQSTRVNGRKDWAALLFLRTYLDADHWVGTTGRVTSTSRAVTVETGRQLDQGEGVGYRVGMNTFSQAGEESVAATAAAHWNLRPVTLELLGSSPVRGNGAQYTELAVSGAVAGVDGAWGFTRRIDDSFVLARLGVPHPGVEISLNNQVQGTTDAQGRLFLPNVGSFGRQDVTLNDKQLPLQYTLNERRKTIAPPYRSGTVVDFAARKVRAIAGMAWQHRGNQHLPIASRSWTMSGPAGTLAIATGQAGDFYVEDAPPGTYRGTVDLVGGIAAACTVTVPDFPDPIHELKEGIICD